jgi:ArsR family metal-binding transcriptional regulator
METLTTFPRYAEFERMKAFLEKNKTPFKIISPGPAYELVGVPSIVIDDDHRAICMAGNHGSITSGWVDYGGVKNPVPSTQPAKFEKDIFGNAAVMVLQTCIADQSKIRAVVHISGNLADSFPYMNAIRANAFYNQNEPTFSYMDEYRMISLHSSRIAVAKADDIIDLWRIIESIRVSFNRCWAERDTISPFYELRKRPAALDIYFHLPKTNCGQCGEKACMAFALKLWSGQTSLFKCEPVFAGEYAHLKKGLFEICAGLDVFHE